MKMPLRTIGFAIVLGFLISSVALSAPAGRPPLSAAHNAVHNPDAPPPLLLSQMRQQMWQQQQQQQQRTWQQSPQRTWQQPQRTWPQQGSQDHFRQQDRFQRRDNPRPLPSPRQQEAAREARLAQERAARARRIEEQRMIEQTRRVEVRKNRLRQDRFQNQQRAQIKERQTEAANRRDTTNLAVMSLSRPVALSPGLTTRLQNITRRPANDNTRSPADDNAGVRAGTNVRGGASGGPPSGAIRTGGAGPGGPFSLTRTFKINALQKGGENAKPIKLAQHVRARLDRIKKLREQERIAKLKLEAKKRLDRKSIGMSAAVANMPHEFKKQAAKEDSKDAAISLPYARYTRAREIVLKKARHFVRVHGDGNQPGSWLMRPEDIERLTPQQIKDKFAIPGPELPKYVSDVEVPAGTRILVGTVAGNEWGEGGGTQYELREELPESTFVKRIE